MPTYHPDHSHAPGHLPATLAGYVALQREADLARAAARSTATRAIPAPGSAVGRSDAPDVTTRVRGLLSRATVTHRRAQRLPAGCSESRPVPALTGSGRAELACCA